MSPHTSPVFLRDLKSGRNVAAQLIDGISETQLADVENCWTPALLDGLKHLAVTGRPKSQWPQSSHWDWRAKVERVRDLLAYRGFALECEDHTQGLMQVKTTELCRVATQSGKPLVYIEYLETAPWNQRELVARPRFAGIGTVMLWTAVRLSQEEGFSGRIGLHSLPQADEFYRRCGMTDLGSDPVYLGLRYFELTAKEVKAFLDKGAIG